METPPVMNSASDAVATYKKNKKCGMVMRSGDENNEKRGMVMRSGDPLTSNGQKERQKRKSMGCHPIGTRSLR